MSNNQVEPGFYQHFKGNLYEVIGVATHTETNELLVIYRDANFHDKIFARPIEMFTSEVDKEKYPNAKQKMRFKKVWFETKT